MRVHDNGTYLGVWPNCLASVNIVLVGNPTPITVTAEIVLVCV